MFMLPVLEIPFPPTQVTEKSLDDGLVFVWILVAK